MTNSIAIQTSEELDSDADIVLSVQGVSKKFCRSLKQSLFYGLQDIAAEIVGLRHSTEELRQEEFWALDNVSFTLRRGESLGIVGLNGSGKTTLLRIISGLIRPDAGSVKIKGRVAPLIALGAGFSPILTGRENIYANMAILGLSTEEIDTRLQDVIDFAEIGEAIDSPVQSYSSGMAARLGFACAIYTQPDILLVDEVLSVGDIRFQAKCQRRLAELLKKGTSFVLVSHASQLIVSVCNHCIYLATGKVLASGDPRQIMDQYQKDLFSIEAETNFDVFTVPEKKISESHGVDITYFCFKDVNKNIVKSPLSGDPIYFCVGCKIHKNIENLGIYLSIFQLSEGGNLALHLNSHADSKILENSPGEFEIRLEVPYLGLRPGTYAMNIYIKDGSVYVFDAHEGFRFNVLVGDNTNQGIFYQPRNWDIVGGNG